MSTTPKNFNPGDVVRQFDEILTWSGHKLGDGNWTAVAYLKGGRELELEELASSWKVTDVSAEPSVSSSSAATLEAALKKAGIR